MSTAAAEQTPSVRVSDAEQAATAPDSAATYEEPKSFYVRDPNDRMVSQVISPPYEQLGNPGPMGLYSFAITTFMLGLYHCGAGLPHSDPASGVGPDQAVLGTSFFMGGITQFAAGMWEIRVGNSFGATLHSSYGAFWLAYSCFLIPGLGIKDAYKGDAHAFGFAMGIFLISWGWLTFLFLLAALRTNYTIIGTLSSLVLTFLFMAIGEFVTPSNALVGARVGQAGGAMAVVTSMLAFYAGSAGLFIPETTYFEVKLGKRK